MSFRTFEEYWHVLGSGTSCDSKTLAMDTWGVAVASVLTEEWKSWEKVPLSVRVEAVKQLGEICKAGPTDSPLEMEMIATLTKLARGEL